VRERRDTPLRRHIHKGHVDRAIRGVRAQHADEGVGRPEGCPVLRRERGSGRRSEDEVPGVGPVLGHRDQEHRLQVERRVIGLQVERRVIGETIYEPAGDLPGPRAGSRIDRTRAERHDRDGSRRHPSSR